MDSWQISLIVSAIVFFAFLVFRMRPAVTSRARASAALLNEAKKRIDGAKDDRERADAAADAGDACARLGRSNMAASFYLRALRADPTSAAIIERATTSLSRRSAALENLMWRYLGHQSWGGPNRDASMAALRTLAHVYAKRKRQHARGHAINHALVALGAAPVASRESKAPKTT